MKEIKISNEVIKQILDGFIKDIELRITQRWVNEKAEVKIIRRRINEFKNYSNIRRRS